MSNCVKYNRIFFLISNICSLAYYIIAIKYNLYIVQILNKCQILFSFYKQT